MSLKNDLAYSKPYLKVNYNINAKFQFKYGMESIRYVPQNSLRHTTGGYISINSTKQAHYIRTQVPSQNWFWILFKTMYQTKYI